MFEQTQQFSTIVSEVEQNYWQQKLSGSIPIIEMPSDRPRLAVTKDNYASHSFQLNSETIELLKQYGIAQDISIDNILFATFLVLLYRYTNLDDLALASHSFSRDQEKADPVILRANLADDPSFKDLIGQVQQLVSEASSQNNYSLASTIEQLLPEEGLAHFKVWFEFQTETEQEKLQYPELFDLSLAIIEQETSFLINFQYNRDLYDAFTLTRIAEHWQILVVQSLTEPQQPVSKLTMLSVEEHARLLTEWNQTQVDYPTDKLIYQLFEAQAEQNPNAIAVVFEDKKLTYAQLNKKANQLAHHLQTLGVKPEVLVGICIERSLEMVIGLVAILKTGGAYVPIDPHYPEDRLSYMLDDSQVKVLLSQRSLVDSLPSHQAQVFCLDSDWQIVEKYSPENLNLDIGAENLAYVIYTSGSTGKPKGVMNTHKGIHNRLCWMQAAYGLDGRDRVLQKTPFSFDVSVWEFFWTLMMGATMVVAKPEGHKDSNYLIDLITKQQVTTMHFVPSMLQVFLLESNVSECSSLKRVFCSGEALSVELTKRFFERLQCQLHNLYGPTEAAIDVTFWQCQPEDNLQVVPIGRPIANTQTYILDQHLQPVPIGVLGELYLGGVNLARGYLNRPELTQEKFIANPLTKEISPRLYKTGDLARYRHDGNIEYMGRIDHQVKLRGFRIELGEIEAVLDTHPQVQQAVVLATEDPTGNKRLVAYLATDENPPVSQLRDFLAAKLPEYMVPAIFVTLDTIPLTPNGKVDRRALPAPDIRQEMEKLYQEPITENEQLIANIWQAVFKLEKVGTNDNFFELGGNSLLAMQIISRIMQQISTINLSINSLFELPTIKELAQIVEGQIPTNPEQSDRFTQELDYWRSQLADAPPLLELPTDRARPTVQNDKSDRLKFELSRDLTESLKSLSQQEGVTLDNTLLSAFKALLYRHTGQSDIVIGSPIFNPNSADIDNITGDELNTLVLRTNLADDWNFQNLLNQVQEVTSEASAHGNIPFDKLLEELQPEKDLSYHPLFQVMFAFQKNQLTRNSASNMAGEIGLPDNYNFSMLDLALELEETTAGISGHFEYKTDLFDRETITRMVGHWQNLLTAIVENPQRQIAHLPLLTKEEKQTLIDWNPAPSFQSQPTEVQQLFEAQVDQNPNAVALVFGELELTYQELNQKANQLAHHLQSLGVTSETLVGLCVERSFEAIIGIWGVLKAGGAYVPLDPTYPVERIAYIVEDANLAVLLTQSKWQDRLPASQAQTINLDTDWTQISKCSDKNLELKTTEDNLAYLIYTSGSTGKPKGVMITHQCLGHFISASVQAYEITSSDRFLQFASISFDMAVEEIFPVLCTGATLVLRSDEMIVSPQTFFQTCDDWKITAMNLPTAFWHQMTAELIEQQVSFPESLRLIMIGGEAVKPDPIKAWQEYINKSGKKEQLRLMNAYGPTEATVTATMYWIPSDTSAIIERVPIGRPITNTQAYILDQHLQPVPIGVVGELYLGGVSLARGYLNRPDLTQEKFIPNPLPEEISKSPRLYKTGDLARYCNGGNIEYMGRIDDQVKVRGFRIELGEIEAVLDTHPQIQQAVVITVEDLTGNNLLVAYVVTDDSLIVEQLREFLAAKLPAYMIPKIFVTLDSIPLTSSNKVDRRALPEPDIQQSVRTSYQAPTNEEERTIADIWQKILNLEKVGIDDNFFELGGNSLLAMQIVSQIMQQLSLIDLSLNSLLDLPTIKELSQDIAHKRQVGYEPVSSIQLFDRSQDLPLSSGEQSLCFFELLHPQSYVYNIPHTFVLSGQVEIGILEQSLNQIIGRHEILRTAFHNQDGQPNKIIAANLTLKLPVIDVETENQARQIAHHEAHQPFELEQTPLLRVKLIRLPEDRYWLLLTCHHIIFDGWSEHIFFEELMSFYNALSKNQPVSLSELAIQYVDYGHWQQQWLQNSKFNQELEYWRSQLADAPPLIELPTDRPRPMVQSYQGSYVEFELASDLTNSLNSLSRQQGVTLYMTLLAAFKSLLYRYTGQPDILVGSPFANRNSVDTENLIGYFVNTLALRTNFAEELSFQDLLSQVRRITSAAYAHANIPFDKLVEELQPKRDLSYNPLFQVMFVLQKQNTPIQLDSALTWEIAKPSILDGSMFDITLQLQETTTGIAGHFEYKTDLFDRETIVRMIGHFQNLLTEIVANPETQIAHLPLLTSGEKQSLIDCNHSPKFESQPQGIQQLFEAQVDKNPDALAVVFGDSHLTYQELNQKANQLAHYLQSQGVGAEILVGICVERSLEMIIGLLGILKAGGAYVPLDPAYPQERLAYMVEDANISVLLTQTKLQGRLPVSQAQIVDLDADWSKIPGFSNENPQRIEAEDPLAYVIYTSGSTGKPKGVMITHRSLSYFTRTAIQSYCVTPSDRMLQFASINFDVAVEEIFPSLCGGATLVLRSAAMVADVGTFFRACEELRLTVINLPTTYWHQLTAELSEKNASLPESLRLVIIGGEAALSEAVKSWQEYVNKSGRQDSLHLLNSYGPTETTVSATMYQIPIDTSVIVGEVPIGRSMAHLQTYILDRNQQLVPIGIPGELYIGGDSLARGYLNRPKLSQERFIPIPQNLSFISTGQDNRLYRTGDLVRYLPDGEIEYLGRIDNQVKIRGFRIELGEIESMLTQHPQVKEAAVTVNEDSSNNKRLIAYIVSSTAELQSQQIRSFLQERLPSYMVPSGFIFLDAMPLMPNGKLDRRALPTPDISREADDELVLPTNDIEAKLAEIWSKILNVDPISIEDNFFELGGHSLLAVKLMGEIESQFNRKLPLTVLFEAPTIKKLGSMLQISQERVNVDSLVTLKKGTSQTPLFLIHDADGETMMYLNLARHLQPEQTVYGLRPPSPKNSTEPILHTRISEIAEQYIKEIRRVQPQGPYLVGGLCAGGVLAFEIACQLQAQGEQVPLVAIIDAINIQGTGYDIYTLANRDRKQNFLKLFDRGEESNLLISLTSVMKTALGKISNLVSYEVTSRSKNLTDNLQIKLLRYCLDHQLAIPQCCQNLSVRSIYSFAEEDSNRELLKVYQGQLTLWRATEKLDLDNPAIDDTPAIFEVKDPLLGWEKNTTQGVAAHDIPGGHSSMLQEPNVQTMAQKLQSYIDSVLES